MESHTCPGIVIGNNDHPVGERPALWLSKRSPWRPHTSDRYLREVAMPDVVRIVRDDLAFGQGLRALFLRWWPGFLFELPADGRGSEMQAGSGQ